jgi:hypothetical protein
VIQKHDGERRQALLAVKRFRPLAPSAPSYTASKLEGGAAWPSRAAAEAGVKASEAHTSQASNPSIERTSYSRLRLLPLAAHVER